MIRLLSRDRDHWTSLTPSLDTIQDFFVQVGHETTYAAIENYHFSLKHDLSKPL